MSASRWLAPLLLLAVATAASLALARSNLPKAAPSEPDWTPAALQSRFARPTELPHPADNPPSLARIALGERLFNEKRLSAGDKLACATCHDPVLGFADGSPVSTAGVTSKPLRRHTPALWNLAWAPLLYWDGRATSLEDQARFPLSHPDEMASSADEAAVRLEQDDSYRLAFKTAFPQSQQITGGDLLKALAAYERTLVSPPTRFDRWLAGDTAALEADERLGLRLFLGKGGCVNCHSGFAFTDHAFHDIGLPGDDRGRADIVGLPRVAHAFKTPGLRELTWTAPYMHDGSLASLEDVVRHYEGGGAQRPSRSPDMPRPFTLTDDERKALVVFLESLSSETPPRPSQEAWLAAVAPPKPLATAISATTVSQRDKAFSPISIRVRRGAAVTILNDDTRAHNVRIKQPGIDYNSGVQEPGDSVSLKFDSSGPVDVHCGIHPTMRLRIEVE